MNQSPTPEVKIRTAAPQDNILLAEFGAQAFSDTFASQNTPENMRLYLAGAFSPQIQAAELADPATVFLIAEIGRQIAGYARLRRGPAPECVTGRQPVEIVRLYAGKEWLGRGVGAALMQACLDEARRQGCDTAWLDVWEKNPRAIAFYRKWGFEVSGTQTFQLGDDLQTDLLMARQV